MDQTNTELYQTIDAENMSDDYTHKKGVGLNVIVYKNQFHIIFCPKYRRKVLVNGVENRLKEILLQVAKDKNVEIKALEVKPDHVHVFVDFDPRLNLHKIVKDFKRTSSGILREEFPWLKSRLPCLWTRNYFVCSVGDISEESIKTYIANQKNT